MANSTAFTISPGFLHSQLWSNRARALLKEGDYEAALHCFCEALVEETAVVDNYVSQAVCLIYLDCPEAALRACDRAISLASDSRRAWLFRGVALHRLGRFREAYACYDLAMGQQPSRRYASLCKRFRVGFRSLKSFLKEAFEGSHSHLRLH